MDAAQLAARQQPLKEQFRKDPDSATITLTADGVLSEIDVACNVATGSSLLAAGLHPMSGGDGTLACSGDMLLQALVACAGVTLKAVATARGVDVAGTVHAEGDLDFRGTLGVDRSAPVGFRAVRLRFDFAPTVPDEVRGDLVEVTKRYCVVLQTIATGVEVDTTWGVPTRGTSSEG